MHSRIAIAVTMLIIVLGSPGPATTVAQDPERGTTLVCAGDDGAGVALQKFPPEQVAEYEEQTGQEVVTVHPVTGTCQDPAGLTLAGLEGCTADYSWVCILDRDGQYGR